ncbi:NusA N-terminal domain-containing protein [Mycoplasma procyoni]|uniref:NusA N-terminal domain-containing protein n=1 Tax=Mycoplasma procyoni TaxID=568784 RepID=UPI00197BAB7C|nr:NusA N-terminal domain-containing protein [Mycoplasma procyoni]MBN3535031.1 hypothetical protein [Mycoplasma procyoni]
MAKKLKSETTKTSKKDFFKLLEEVSSYRNIGMEGIATLLEEAFQKIINKVDQEAEIKLVVDYKRKDFKLINSNALVLEDQELEEILEEADESIKVGMISLSEAKEKYDKNIEAGDSLEIEIDFETLPKSVFTPVQQLFKQKITEIVRKNIYEKYLPLKGTLIKAKQVSTVRSGYLYEILEDKVQAFMPRHFSSKKKNETGAVEDVYIEDVLAESKDTQIIISNSSNNLLKELITREIPEVASGRLVIERISRMPGVRSKVAIKSATEEDFDNEIGTIVGKDGSRIEGISSELQEERIDIIKFSENIEEFITNSLSPAKVISVISPIKSKKINKFIVIVPDSQHTLAIGKQGINVTLAAELTRTKIDLTSYSKAIAAGINFEWNGNIKDEKELEVLEAEIRNIKSQNKRLSSPFKSKQSSRNQKTYSLDEMDADINSMNEFLFREFEKDSQQKQTPSVAKEKEKFDADNIIESALNDFESSFEEQSDAHNEPAYTKEELENIQEEIKNYSFDNDLANYTGLKEFDLDKFNWDDEEEDEK